MFSLFYGGFCMRRISVEGLPASGIDYLFYELEEKQVSISNHTHTPLTALVDCSDFGRWGEIITDLSQLWVCPDPYAEVTYFKRSIWSWIVFAKYANTLGYIQSDEFLFLKTLFITLLQKQPKPDLILYFPPNLKACPLGRTWAKDINEIYKTWLIVMRNRLKIPVAELTSPKHLGLNSAYWAWSIRQYAETL